VHGTTVKIVKICLGCLVLRVMGEKELIYYLATRKVQRDWEDVKYNGPNQLQVLIHDEEKQRGW